MQDEALSTSSPTGVRSARRQRLWIALPIVLVVLYFAGTSGVRWFVSHKIESVVGRSVPEFTLKDTSGRAWSSQDLAGRMTVLSFFRSMCPSCRKERDAVRTLAREAESGGPRVLSVMMDRVQGFPEAVTAKTLDEFGFEHPVLMADQAFVDAFHGAGWSHVTPVTYVVDAKGIVRAALRGHQTLETLRGATR